MPGEARFDFFGGPLDGTCEAIPVEDPEQFWQKKDVDIKLGYHARILRYQGKIEQRGEANPRAFRRLRLTTLAMSLRMLT